MTDTKWGEPIERGSLAWPVDQVRPSWLGDDDRLDAMWADGLWYGEAMGDRSPTFWRHLSNPPDLLAIRLPADHWAYRVIRAGFRPWAGGDEPPADWDGSEVLLRNGIVGNYGPNADWIWEHFDEETDLIGYRPKPSLNTLPDDPGPPIMERRLLPDVPEGYMLVPIVPTEAMLNAACIYDSEREANLSVWFAMTEAAQSDPSTGEKGGRG